MKRRIKPCWTCSDYVRHEHRWRWTAWICGRIQRLWLAIRRALVLSVEYEVHTTDTAGDWQLWSDGFHSRESADDYMRECIRLRKSWVGPIKLTPVRWRVARKVVFTKYFDAK